MSQYEQYIAFYRLLRQGATIGALAPFAESMESSYALICATTSLDAGRKADKLERPFHERQGLEYRVIHKVVSQKYVGMPRIRWQPMAYAA